MQQPKCDNAVKNVHQSLFKGVNRRSVCRSGKRGAGTVRPETGHKIASYYRENISGTKLDRPELKCLLMDSHRNDILLVEQIDRLTRLSNSDWITLKKQIEQHELRIVSLDVPTSWQALSDKAPSQ